MFGKLFGAKPEEKKAPTVDVSQTQEKLNDQIENIEMRKKKIENECADLKKDAI